MFQLLICHKSYLKKFVSKARNLTWQWKITSFSRRYIDSIWLEYFRPVMFVLGGVYHRFLHPFWPNWNYISPSPRFPWNSRGHFPSKISYLLGPKSVVFSVAREFDQMLPFIFWSHFPWAFPDPSYKFGGFSGPAEGADVENSPCIPPLHHSTLLENGSWPFEPALVAGRMGSPEEGSYVLIGSHPMYKPFV